MMNYREKWASMEAGEHLIYFLGKSLSRERARNARVDRIADFFWVLSETRQCELVQKREGDFTNYIAVKR